MNHKQPGIICFILIFLNGPLISQSPSVLRSALGTGGASISLSSGSTQISFQQSIGQFGVAGVFSKANLELRQGFLQPVIGVRAPLEAEKRKFSVYPNPFSSVVYVKLNGDVSGRIYLSVIDLAGKPVYSNRTLAEELIQLDLNFLERGIYILIVKSYNIQTHHKIIKY